MSCESDCCSKKSRIAKRAIAGIGVGQLVHLAICPLHGLPALLLKTGIITGAAASPFVTAHDYLVRDVVEPVVSFVRGEDESTNLPDHSQLEHHGPAHYNLRNERITNNLFIDPVWGASPAFDYLRSGEPLTLSSDHSHCDHEHCNSYSSRNEQIAHTIVDSAGWVAAIGIPAAFIGIPFYRNRRREAKVRNLEREQYNKEEK